MILIGLTGGIGSGKSTASALLAERGAVVIDADAITHEVQQKGQPVLAAIAERFGPGVLTPDGELDRPGLAAIVFNDTGALADLMKIVHPVVSAEIERRIEEQKATDHVVVLDIALLAEKPRPGLAAVVVVDVPVDVAIERLVRQRGMSEVDARARMDKQVSRESRLARATRVLDNSGSRHALAAQVADLWDWLRTLPPYVEPEAPSAASTSAT
jgi:dephospho-CoA kinase